MKKFLIPVKVCLIFFSLLHLAGNYCRAEIYKYKDENGIWYYTDNPLDLPEDSVTLKDETGEKEASKDLQRHLAAQCQQRNEIEKATCSVVAIQSTIGYGSGFFITDDGYILTNKHVLKGDQQQQEMDQNRIQDITEEIKRINEALAKEEQKLKAFKEKLEKENLDQDEYYLNRYKEWEKDFNQRKKAFKEQEVTINNDISDYRYKRAMAEISRYFKILTADNSEFTVYLISTSQNHDLALLKLDGHKTPYLKPADSQKFEIGETVYAVGNPARLRNSVSKGIISGFEGNFIKTDAKIYPGNSGGPLMTDAGKVIGINTFKKLTRKFEGLGFAISIETAINEFRSELGKRIVFE